MEQNNKRVIREVVSSVWTPGIVWIQKQPSSVELSAQEHLIIVHPRFISSLELYQLDEPPVWTLNQFSRYMAANKHIAGPEHHHTCKEAKHC